MNSIYFRTLTTMGSYVPMRVNRETVDLAVDFVAYDGAI